MRSQLGHLSCLRATCACFGLLFSLLLSTDSAGEEFGYFTYELVDEEVTITDYSVFSTNDTVIVPSRIDGAPVTAIGDHAFFGNSIGFVILPPGVRTIGDSAFFACRRLRHVELPDTLLEIGEYAFRSCLLLGSIAIPPNVTTIGAHAFWNCDSLEEAEIPSSVTHLENGLFRSTGLRRITLGHGIESIGGSVFRSCGNLESLEIPASVKSISGSAFFSSNRLLSVHFLGDAPEAVSYLFRDLPPDASISFECGRVGFDQEPYTTREVVEAYHRPASLAIESITKTLDGTVLTISGSCLGPVGVEYSPDLSPGSWIELGNISDLGFLDSDVIRRSRPRGYYRAFARP